MKATILLLSLVITSCTFSTVSEQAKSNLSVGVSADKVDSGYELSGHAGTNIFGVEPYASFKVGVKYNPQLETVLVTPEPTVK